MEELEKASRERAEEVRRPAEEEKRARYESEDVQRRFKALEVKRNSNEQASKLLVINNAIERRGVKIDDVLNVVAVRRPFAGRCSAEYSAGYGGRDSSQRPPSVFARWTLHRVTSLGRQAAFELFDQGKLFDFTNHGELYLRQGVRWYPKTRQLAKRESSS